MHSVHCATANSFSFSRPAEPSFKSQSQSQSLLATTLVADAPLPSIDGSVRVSVSAGVSVLQVRVSVKSTFIRLTWFEYNVAHGRQALQFDAIRSSHSFILVRHFCVHDFNGSFSFFSTLFLMGARLFDWVPFPLAGNKLNQFQRLCPNKRCVQRLENCTTGPRGEKKRKELHSFTDVDWVTATTVPCQVSQQVAFWLWLQLQLCLTVCLSKANAIK